MTEVFDAPLNFVSKTSAPRASPYSWLLGLALSRSMNVVHIKELARLPRQSWELNPGLSGWRV